MTRFYDEAGYEIPRTSMLIELDESGPVAGYRDRSPIPDDHPVKRAARAIDAMRARQQALKEEM